MSRNVRNPKRTWPASVSASTTWKEASVKKIRISKRRQPGKRRLEPLSLDLRDDDIMRAKQLASPSPAVPYHRSRRAA
jgi:hypothetical protein